MKKSTLFKSIAAAALFMVGMSANAQVVTVSNAQASGLPAYDWASTSSYTTTGTETATYGAQMPYYVVPDANVNGTLFNASSFIWTYTGITALTQYNNASNTITSGGPDVLYHQVTATMPTSGASATLKVQEKSNPKVGTGCTDGTGKTITITLVDKPSMAGTSSADLGGCGLSTSYSITPSSLTGTAPFYVEYTITGVDINGTAIGTSEKYTAKLASATTDIIITDTQLAHLGSASSVANTVKGKYTVTITKVWDTYSAKAINRDDLAATPTGTSTCAIYVYPTPATGDIQHISTL